MEFIRADPELTQEIDKATRVALGSAPPDLLDNFMDEEDMGEEEGGYFAAGIVDAGGNF